MTHNVCGIRGPCYSPRAHSYMTLVHRTSIIIHISREVCKASGTEGVETFFLLALTPANKVSELHSLPYMSPICRNSVHTFLFLLASDKNLKSYTEG